jgi:hypothetical protein
VSTPYQLRCQWFALCDHEATVQVRHPVLGLVPTCDRCVARMGLQADVVADPAEASQPSQGEAGGDRRQP